MTFKMTSTTPLFSTTVAFFSWSENKMLPEIFTAALHRRADVLTVRWCLFWELSDKIHPDRKLNLALFKVTFLRILPW